VPTQLKEHFLIAGDMSASAWVFKKPSANANNFLQLDVNISSPLLGTRTLIESFAGWGEDERSAINSAWSKFSTASLHVLLEVFALRQRHDDQVEWERWGNDRNPWQVCIGPLYTISFTDQPLPNLACGGLLDQLRDALMPRIGREYHWLRFYYMKNDSSRVGSECLLDNNAWPEGQSIVDQWNWPDGSYSARLFLMILPAEK
jgi:uncharacterized protein DUF6348